MSTDRNPGSEVLEEILRLRARVAELEGRGETSAAIRHQLARHLGGHVSLQQAADLILNAVLRLSGMDCGGVYVVDKAGGLRLLASSGLTERFRKGVSAYGADSPRTKLVMDGKPVYAHYSDMILPREGWEEDERLKALGVIPVVHGGRSVACINIGSHAGDEVPVPARADMENLASYLGHVIARLQSEEALKKTLDDLERRIQERTEELSQANEVLRAEIAQRKRAESALQAREALLHSMFAEAAIGMAIVSPDGHFLRANRACCEFLGFSEEELLDRTVRDITHPDDREATARAIREALTGSPAIQRFEKRYLGKDGEAVWGEVSVSVVRDAVGQPAYAIAQLQDIRDRKRAEAALQEERDRLAALVNSIRDEIWFADAHGHFTLVNASGSREFGLEANAVTDVRQLAASLEVLRPDGTPRPIEEAPSLRALRGEVVTNQEESVRTPATGELRYRQVNAAPVRDGKGRIIGSVSVVRDITESKRTEAALRGSEETLRVLLNATTDVLILMGLDGRILVVNEATAQRWGRRADEVIGFALWEFLAPDVARTRRAHFEECVRSRHTVQFEDRHGERWWDTIFYPVHDSQGAMVRVAVYARDITKRKLAQEALSESQETIRAILDAAVDSVFLIDASGKCLVLNEAAARRLGRNVDEVVGVDLYSLLSPELAKARKAYLDETIRTGRPTRFEDERDGLWLDHGICPIRDSRGQVARVAIFARDVTARRRAEQALQESEERYRRLFEDSPVALIEQDIGRLMEFLDGLKAGGTGDLRRHFEGHPEDLERCIGAITPLDANRVAVKFLGAAGRGHLLREYASVLCDETRKQIADSMAALADGQTAWEGETVLRTLRGDRKEVLVSLSAVLGDKHRRPKCLAAISDLTELHLAEREIARQKQLAMLQRMEALATTGRLAAGVAHEINNPLQGIVAQLRLLSDEVPADVRHGRRMKLIRDSVGKISNIVANLLQLHRPMFVGEESCSASAVIANVADLITPMASSPGIKVVASVVPRDMTVPLSANALTQVLLNLALNAIDAMPSGGVMRIEATRTEGETVVRVSDSGVGIPPEFRSRLFSPFFTTKGPKGTGLGLSVTHSLVASAGGTIEVSDYPGGGTTFSVRFERGSPGA